MADKVHSFVIIGLIFRIILIIGIKLILLCTNRRNYEVFGDYKQLSELWSYR